MFELMPGLLIFLSSALTMRMWSEERRSGTLEHVMTLPVSPWSFVLGKFSACKSLLIIALALTLPLPITISLIGDIDWGPIFSGYIATLFLGSAYIAIGLFVSSRCDNQIVSFILSATVCGFLYALGSDVLTKFFAQDTSELLRSLGSGSRFESITRGLLDVRDLYYYVSITAIFLILNRYTLEKERWANNKSTENHGRWKLFTSLAIVNLLIANLWLSPLGFLRSDTTEGKIYSISDATETYIDQLREPLLIRGYFSDKTHPLLSPLVPQIKDLIKEYEIKGAGKIRVEFIDPATNPEAEIEAGEKYGIRPNPFRVEDKYQSSLVNSYFNILIEYGDEYKVLGFQDLIEVNQTQLGDVDVRLRNPEYDLTNTLKSVLYAYQSAGNFFDSVKAQVTFSAYISPDEKLPEPLRNLAQTITPILTDTQEKSEGKFSFEFLDPEANGGTVAKQINEDYGFQAMSVSLFDTNTFYYYLVLRSGDTAVQIPLAQDLTKDSFERDLDSALKRFSSGFTKTVGISSPTQNPRMAQFGQAPPTPTFNSARRMLSENLSVKDLDLSTGTVPGDIDLLMVLSPEGLDEKALFAIDQFLMQGGTVVVSTAPLKVNLSQQAIVSSANNSGLDQWLNHHGVSVESTFIMDSQNAAFPLPVIRNMGVFQVQEVQLIDYPYFADIRGDSLNQDNPVTSGLQQLTVPWSSPVNIDATKNQNRNVVSLVSSSEQTWLSDNRQLTPQDTQSLQSAFIPGTIVGSKIVAAAVTGRFDSYFADKPSPLLQKEDTAKVNEESASESPEQTEPQNDFSGIVNRSADSARLVVIGSNTFAEDQVTQILSSITGNQYLSSFEFLTNITEWSLEDSSLLSIRSRAHFNRTLPPMKDDQRQFWETINYVLALLGVVLIFAFRTWQQKSKAVRYRQLLSQGA